MLKRFVVSICIFVLFISFCEVVMAEEETKAEAPKVNIKFLFVMCNDVDVIRHFYTDLLGMTESSYMNTDDWAWICYKSGNMEFMFFRGHEELPVNDEWTWQPGWGGDVDGVSWAINVPEDMYADMVRAIIDDGDVPMHEPCPEWRQESYWGWTIMDPMGNTVELYTTPAAKPDTTTWPEIAVE